MNSIIFSLGANGGSHVIPRKSPENGLVPVVNYEVNKHIEDTTTVSFRLEINSLECNNKVL